MKKIFTLILLFISINSFASDVFVLTDVPVSSVGENAIDAQTKAVSMGQKEAFNLLLNKIVDVQTPVVFEEELDVTPYVQDVSVSDEKMTSQMYKGNLTVRFKAEPVRQLLIEKGARFLTSLPEPMLLVPVFEDEVQTLVFNRNNPIYAYWMTENPKFNLFQIKNVESSDSKLQEAQKAWEKDSFSAYKNILNELGVSSILVLHIKKTGQLYEVETKVLPQNSAMQAHVKLSVTDDRTSLEKVVKDLVADTFRNMQKKWVYLSTKTASPIEIYHLVTPVSKISELTRIKAKINQFNFAEKVEIKGYKNKLLSVDVAFRGDLDELEKKLKLNQMRIESYGVTDTEMPLFLLTEIDLSSVNAHENTVAENGAETLKSDEIDAAFEKFEYSDGAQNNMDNIEKQSATAHIL
ncbi:MAG: hypothetical protein IJY92_07260 [Alphaproteobacteria bacterium]|nr:hypothetical protein [Alphaproteobacteria bacterium]